MGNGQPREPALCQLYRRTFVIRCSTEYGHDDVGVAALYVGKERDHFVDDDHLVETADESVDALERVHSCLRPTDNQLTDRKHLPHCAVPASADAQRRRPPRAHH